jgi:hypothetical protein
MMALAQTIAVYEALDTPKASGQTVVDLFRPYTDVAVHVATVHGAKGRTDFVRIDIVGTGGKSLGGSAPTLGIIGRLGGVGARPQRLGLVSDADGALAAIAAGLKLARLRAEGDVLPGDVIITTHICPNAPTKKHDPVDFMDSPVSLDIVNAHEIDATMDAILSIDTTKGNRILSHKGLALSPTVKEGWILRVSEDLIRILEITSGRAAVTFPLTMQDITPYGNDVYHLNSIVQPAVATDAPVAGVAVGAETVVPGSATGASHEVDVALAARFAVEVAKAFTSGVCRFFDPAEFTQLVRLYGSMRHLQHFSPESRVQSPEGERHRSRDGRQ